MGYMCVSIKHKTTHTFIRESHFDVQMHANARDEVSVYY